MPKTKEWFERCTTTNFPKKAKEPKYPIKINDLTTELVRYSKGKNNFAVIRVCYLAEKHIHERSQLDPKLERQIAQAYLRH